MKTILKISALLFFLIFIGGTKSIMATEEPKYKVISEYDEFEIREYDSYIIAETEVNSDLDDASNKAFRILFDYISGNNINQEEIEMTAPVNQTNASKEGEKIEMTAPVSQSTTMNSSGNYWVSFVIPSRFTMGNVPVPKDSRVKIRQVESKTVAVRKYSGSWSEENYRENEQILLEEIKRADLKIVGDPIYARYDAPFIPWFLRRNEVMVEVVY